MFFFLLVQCELLRHVCLEVVIWNNAVGVIWPFICDCVLLVWFELSFVNVFCWCDLNFYCGWFIRGKDIAQMILLDKCSGGWCRCDLKNMLLVWFEAKTHLTQTAPGPLKQAALHQALHNHCTGYAPGSAAPDSAMGALARPSTRRAAPSPNIFHLCYGTVQITPTTFFSNHTVQKQEPSRMS